MTSRMLKYLTESLSEEEINSIESSLVRKLESILEGKELCISNLRTQITGINLNVESQKLANEREMRLFSSKLNLAEDFSDNLKKQLRETEAELQKSRHEYYELMESKESLTQEVKSLKERIERQTQDKLDLSDLLERRMGELNHLQQQIKTITTQLQSANEGKLEVSLQCEDLERRLSSIQRRVMSLEQENELNVNQISNVHQELNAKIAELANERRENAMKLFDAQAELERKEDELKQSQDEVKHLKKVVERKDKQIESCANRIRELQSYITQCENDFKNEIAAQTSLIDHHKQTNSELKRKNEEIVQTLEEMQELLQTAKQAHNDLEETFQSTQVKFREEIEKKISEIASLRKDIEKLKEELERQEQRDVSNEIEKYFPAATASGLMLRRNMNFSQIYSEFIKTQQKLEQEQQENAHLRNQLQIICNEADENGPLLHRRTHENMRAMQTISEMQTQMTLLVKDKEELLSEKDNLTRMNAHLHREIKRFESENGSLALQVRRLIQSVHEARGFMVRHDQDREVTSSDHLSMQNLTFRDIEELQTRNQQLWNLKHELEEKIKELEQEKSNEMDADLQSSLEDALEQIENLRHERKQQAEMVDEVIRQRDMYKSMSSKANEMQSRMSPVGHHALTPTKTDNIAELRSSIDKINSEFARFREESGKRIKDLMEQNDSLRQEVADARTECSKVSAEFSFTQEKIHMLQSNAEQFQTENAVLREVNIKLNANMKLNEQQLVLTRQELLSLKDNIKRLELVNNALTAERDLAKNNEARLSQEKDLIISDHENQKKLLKSWQLMQANLEQLEVESKSKSLKLRSQIEHLESECRSLRAKLEREQQLRKEVSLTVDRQSLEYQNKLEKEAAKYYQLQQEVADIHTQVHTSEVNPVLTIMSCFASDITKVKTNYEKQIESFKIMEKELLSCKDEIASKNAEMLTLNTSVESMQEQNATLQNTVAQLRKLARKYKTQNEEYASQNKDLNQLMKQKETGEKSGMIEEGGEALLGNEVNISEYEQKITEANDRIKELEEQNTELEKNLEIIVKDRDEAKRLVSEKEEKVKKLAAASKQRIVSLTGDKDRLIKEKDESTRVVTELKEKMTGLEQHVQEYSMRLTLIKSQYESKMNKQSKELSEANAQIEELKSRLQALQQSVSAQPVHAQPQQSSSSVIGVTTPVQVSSNTTPVRHSVHPQQQAVQQAKSTPTASIRPLAIGLPPVTHVPRGTRAVSTPSRSATIATVQPTTDTIEVTPHQSVPQATVQPTTSTQPQTSAPSLVVIPTQTPIATAITTLTQEDQDQDQPSTSSQQQQEVMEEAQQQQQQQQQADVAHAVTSMQGEVPEQQDESVMITSESAVADVSLETIEPIELSDQSEIREHELHQDQSQACVASTSSQQENITTETSSQPLKRTLNLADNDSLSSSSPKRACIPAHVESQEQIIPDSGVEEEHYHLDVEPSQPPVSGDEHKPVDKEIGQSEVEDEDVIVLDSDDDDEQVNEQDQSEEDEQEDEEFDEAEDEMEAEDEEQYEDESELENEEDFQDEEEGSDGSEYEEHVDEQQDEVEERRDEDDIDAQMESEDNSQQQVATVPQQMQILDASNDQLELDSSNVIDSDQPSSSSSIIPISSSQLHPFIQVPAAVQQTFPPRQTFYQHQHHAQQSSVYDEGDGIVPSTPTLFVPRRGDGFAEVINSPRVPQGRFVFNSSISDTPELSQLASDGTEGTLGVDDTRMDLSQFDDNNNGRSVPTTPLPTSPLVENVTQQSHVADSSSTSLTLQNIVEQEGIIEETSQSVSTEQQEQDVDEDSSQKVEEFIEEENVNKEEDIETGDREEFQPQEEEEEEEEPNEEEPKSETSVESDLAKHDTPSTSTSDMPKTSGRPRITRERRPQTATCSRGRRVLEIAPVAGAIRRPVFVQNEPLAPRIPSQQAPPRIVSQDLASVSQPLTQQMPPQNRPIQPRGQTSIRRIRLRGSSKYSANNRGGQNRGRGGSGGY